MNGMTLLIGTGCFIAGSLLGGLLTQIGLRIAERHPVVTPVRRYMYLVMMVLSGCCFVLMVAASDKTSELAAGLFLVSVLIALSASDLKYRLLPNKIVYPAIVLFMVWRFFFHPLPLWHYFLGFLLGGGIIYLASYVAVKLHRPPMGGGDIKLMALLGLALGAELVVFTLLLSSFIGAVSGLALMAVRRMNRQDFLPFGPFIAIAGITAWLYGESALRWYYGFFTY